MSFPKLPEADGETIASRLKKRGKMRTSLHLSLGLYEKVTAEMLHATTSGTYLSLSALVEIALAHLLSLPVKNTIIFDGLKKSAIVNR